MRHFATKIIKQAKKKPKRTEVIETEHFFIMSLNLIGLNDHFSLHSLTSHPHTYVETKKLIYNMDELSEINLILLSLSHTRPLF